MFSLWRSLAVELLGSFILGTVLIASISVAATAGGSTVASALTYAFLIAGLFMIFNVYSGSHLNPIISFGFAVAGRMNWGLMFLFWISQLLGFIAAGALVAYFFANESSAFTGSLTGVDNGKAFLVDMFFGFFLTLVFLFVTRNPILSAVAGILIGFTYGALYLGSASLTGGSLNPGLAIGAGIFTNSLGSIWTNVVGLLLGSAIAALVYKLFTVDFNCCDLKDECGKPLRDACGNKLKECKRPVLDACGNEVKDCNGCVVYETYQKVEVKENFMQANFLTAAGAMLAEHGINPMYAKQELAHSLEGAHSSLEVLPQARESVVVLKNGDAAAAGARDAMQSPLMRAKALSTLSPQA